MPVSLKYAVVERERRFLLTSLPEGVVEVACTNFYRGARPRSRSCGPLYLTEVELAGYR